MKKRVVAVVEVRKSSTRLPGKAMKKIMGRPILSLLLERLKRAESLDAIVVATSDHPEDKILADLASEMGVKSYRGGLDDVLSRVIVAVKSVDGDIIVEIMGDCPLLDHRLIDEFVSRFLESDVDYLSNVLEATYPAGLDVQVSPLKIIEEIGKIADTPEMREHFSWYIYKDGDESKYSLKNIRGPKELYFPYLRLMLDYPEDLEFITQIYENLYPEYMDFDTYDIIGLLEKKPELKKISGHLVITMVDGQSVADMDG